jgi:hypothetical protein
MMQRQVESSQIKVAKGLLANSVQKIQAQGQTKSQLSA